MLRCPTVVNASPRLPLQVGCSLLTTGALSSCVAEVQQHHCGDRTAVLVAQRTGHLEETLSDSDCSGQTPLPLSPTQSPGDIAVPSSSSGEYFITWWRGKHPRFPQVVVGSRGLLVSWSTPSKPTLGGLTRSDTEQLMRRWRRQAGSRPGRSRVWPGHDWWRTGMRMWSRCRGGEGDGGAGGLAARRARAKVANVDAQVQPSWQVCAER